MIKVSIMFPRLLNGEFDFRYYIESHMVMIKNLMGSALIDCTVEKGIASFHPEERSPFIAIAVLTFKSWELFESSFLDKANVKKIQADISSFTSIEPLLQVSEVTIAR